MSRATQFEAGRSTTQRKGGSPEDARQKDFDMDAITETLERINTPRIIASTDSEENKAGKWLEQQIAKAKKEGVITLDIEVGPALAAALLKRNDGNRKISEPVVERYARDMKSGSWKFNGQAIIVSSDGHLNDGQHRCEGIISADMEVRSLLVIGVERESRTTLDQGRTRTAGDYLAMEGYTNTNHLAGIGSIAWQYSTMGRLATVNRERPTKSEILTFVEDHPNLIRSLNMCAVKGASSLGGISLIAAAHWIFSVKAGKAEADTFIVALLEGANLQVGNPILYVRNRLINEGRKLKTAHRLELLIKAWNSYRANQDIRAYSVAGGKLPKVSR